MKKRPSPGIVKTASMKIEPVSKSGMIGSRTVIIGIDAFLRT